MFGGANKSPEFIPVHKYLRSYHQRLTVWDLPEEILIHLLKSLHVKDLLCMKQVCCCNTFFTYLQIHALFVSSTMYI